MNFRKKKVESLPTTPQEYPVGSYVSTEQGVFYIKSSDRRIRFSTQRVLDSWSPQRISNSTEKALVKYKLFGKMKFRNGSLIKAINGGKIYLIVENKKCKIISPDVLTLVNASVESAIYVSDEELNLHIDGDDLDFSNNL